MFSKNTSVQKEGEKFPNVLRAIKLFICRNDACMLYKQCPLCFIAIFAELLNIFLESPAQLE